MLSRILGTLTRGLVENYFVEHARDIIKPRHFIAKPNVMHWFESAFLRKRRIKTIKHVSDNKELIAHAFHIDENIDKSSVRDKKAVIYMLGNCHYIAEAFPRIESFMKDFSDLTQKQISCTSVTFFCQDYRGKGYNQHGERDNFNDYSLLQDAKDQAALIHHLVTKENYKPENILICGYSYGSAMGLWAIALLAEKYGSHYANLKIMCDRGFGNLFNYPPVKLFVKDNELANERLRQKNVMPKQHLHDIAMHLPASCVYEVEDPKRGYFEDITLAAMLTKNKMQGRCWRGQLTSQAATEIPHFAGHEDMQIKSIPELKPYHLMVAMLTEKPIVLDSQRQRCGSAISSKDTKVATFSLSTQAITCLLKKIEDYCLERFNKTNNSASFQDYFRWTAQQKIQMAVKIAELLDQTDGANIIELQQLSAIEGPHQSGTLKKILSDVMALVTDLEQLKHFNAWITSLPASRLQNISPQNRNGFFAKANDWEMVEISASTSDKKQTASPRNTPAPSQ